MYTTNRIYNPLCQKKKTKMPRSKASVRRAKGNDRRYKQNNGTPGPSRRGGGRYFPEGKVDFRRVKVICPDQNSIR